MIEFLDRPEPWCVRRLGGNLKGFTRKIWASVREVVSFDQVRFEAFPRGA
jgi:predicted NAD-dependent protein-ADP-ribosyltransferase YbiA (DUF1768 family)